jgi:hypothetical protein
MKRAVPGLILVVAGGCYVEPRVSEPPTLGEPVAFLERDAFGRAYDPANALTESVPPRTSLFEVCPPDDEDCGYSFTVVVPGTAGVFDNGDPEAEQWEIVRVVCEADVDGTAVEQSGGVGTIGGDIDDEPAGTLEPAYELAIDEAGRTFSIACTAFDALDRGSNTATLDLLLEPRP